MELWKNWWKTTSWLLSGTTGRGARRRGSVDSPNTSLPSPPAAAADTTATPPPSVWWTWGGAGKSLWICSSLVDIAPTSQKPLPGHTRRTKMYGGTDQNHHTHTDTLISFTNDCTQKRNQGRRVMGSSFFTHWLQTVNWNCLFTGEYSRSAS